MTEKRYSIDLHENTRTGKIFRIILGVASLVVAVWYMYSIRGTAASVETAWIATGFLLLFSLWLIASGLGYTQRYITVGDDKITLRQEFYRPPVIFTPSSLSSVEFRTLVIDFFAGGQKVTLRLGTFYPEQTAAIMGAVEDFCRRHAIEIRGDRNNGSVKES
jgi:uncharacterized membrane protein